ncbi:hypothetical protein Prum_040650 [Phytohabitans rumicis]|uniref:Uncharacterized protein n=1 Tax=Phytohabitans rumicis TaxID=1076125 RepID=A0A6V8KZ94_9ACTN|nr:hypothetical protein Prum_040650 [Phytohabitans rumicis]
MAQAREAGLTAHDVDRLCRAGRWQRLARGAYLVDPQAVAPRRARIRAAVASAGAGAVAALGTAAELHGIAGLRQSQAIHVTVAGSAAKPHRRTDPALVIHQLAVLPEEVCAVGGIPTTTPVRTAADLILRVDRYVAVSVLDSALNRELIQPEELAAIPALIRGRRGAVAARVHLTEADGRAQSPLETRVRLRCVDGRVRPDALQHAVCDEDGYILGVGDLAWLRARIIGEADGKAPHSLPDAVFQDRRRQNRLANAGWLILRFTWQDTLDPGYIPYVVRAALLSRIR